MTLSPRPGPLGVWDRIVGPGLPAADTVLVLTASLLGACASALLARDLSLPLTLLAAAMGFDILGGAVCNMTATTKAWYHRPGIGLAQHAAFLLPHLIYIALVAAFFRGPAFDAPWCLALSAALVIGALAVHAARRERKSSIAAAALLAGLLLDAYLAPTPALSWFVPALFLKLLIGHLVP